MSSWTARVAPALALLCTLTVGCGAATSANRPGPLVEPEREDPVVLSERQVELEGRLGEELARPEPDCRAACTLGSRICDLAARICHVAERNPRDEDLQDRCANAHGRCDRASQHILTAQCTCR